MDTLVYGKIDLYFPIVTTAFFAKNQPSNQDQKKISKC